MLFCKKQHLRNRKHFPCFYRVIETRVEVWENKKCCGNTSRRWVIPRFFWVLPNLHDCLYNSIETRKKYFLFLLENSPRKMTEKEENLIVLLIIKTSTPSNFTQFTCHNLINQLRNKKQFLCFYRVIETRLLTNQHTCFPWAIFYNELLRSVSAKHIILATSSHYCFHLVKSYEEQVTFQWTRTLSYLVNLNPDLH